MSVREVLPFPLDLDPPRRRVTHDRHRDVTSRCSIGSITILTETGPDGAKLLAVDDLCTFTVSAEVVTREEAIRLPSLDAVRTLAGDRIASVYGEVVALASLRLMERPAISGPVSATVDGRTVVVHFDADMGESLSEVQAANLSRFLRDMVLSGATGDHELVGFDDLDHPITMSVEPVGPRDLDRLDGFSL